MTDFREKLAKIIGDHASQAHRYGAADAIIAALPDMVQPLGWEREDDGSLTAESVIGLYAVFYEQARGWLVMRDGHDDGWADYPSSDDGFDTEDAAMSACRAHYAAQIMEAFGLMPNLIKNPDFQSPEGWSEYGHYGENNPPVGVRPLDAEEKQRAKERQRANGGDL